MNGKDNVELWALDLGNWLIPEGERERITEQKKWVTDTVITSLENKNADGKQEKQEKKLAGGLDESIWFYGC